jgi:hypothetical protein
MSKNCIIDPFTCITKIALLQFLPDKTKLSIGNYIISIQEPSWPLQTIVRTGYDSRDDLWFIYSPIIKAIEWYLVDDKFDKEMKDAIIDIMKHTIYGIEKLQHTYREGNVVLSLQLMKNLITDALESKLNNDHIYVIRQTTDGITLGDSIRENIDRNDINNIRSLLKEASNNQNDINKLRIYVEPIKKLLNIRDQQFQAIMYRINTTI